MAAGFSAYSGCLVRETVDYKKKYNLQNQYCLLKSKFFFKIFANGEAPKDHGLRSERFFLLLKMFILALFEVIKIHTLFIEIFFQTKLFNKRQNPFVKKQKKPNQNCALIWKTQGREVANRMDHYRGTPTEQGKELLNIPNNKAKTAFFASANRTAIPE